MAKNKTSYTEADVTEFIENLENDQRKIDSYYLIDLMHKISGEKPKMFGPTIIGFGEYEYKYDSGLSGKAPLIGFSPRKSVFSLYVYSGLVEHEFYLENLGKYTMGKSCIYVKKMIDINQEALINLMKATIDFIEKKYTRL